MKRDIYNYNYPQQTRSVLKLIFSIFRHSLYMHNMKMNREDETIVSLTVQ